jgi:hypothetical protein
MKGLYLHSSVGIPCVDRNYLSTRTTLPALGFPYLGTKLDVGIANIMGFFSDLTLLLHIIQLDRVTTEVISHIA